MKLFRLRHMPGSGEDERELLLDTDAEADNETPASEPTDIPIQDLLSDLVGVSRRLGVTPRAPTTPNPDDEARDADAEPSSDQALDASIEPDRDQALDAGTEPGEEEESAEPDGPVDLPAAGPSLTGYRRHVLHALFLSLALLGAVGVLMGAERLASTEPTQRPPIVVATVPGIAPGLDGQPEAAAEPTSETALEPTPEAAPEPTPELQPAYFLYTVQPGDTVSGIAAVFAISPAYILWNNSDVIYDPNLVLVGEELLIPSVDGIIYHVKPGDTLSDIAALYEIDVESIPAFAPNGLTSPTNAIAGMVLVLPGAVPPSSDHIWP